MYAGRSLLGALAQFQSAPLGIHEAGTNNLTAGGGANSVLYLDPADWPTGYQPRIRGQLMTNGVTVGVRTFRLDLFPITGFGSTSASSVSTTHGTAVAGAGIVLATNPAISTGYYVKGAPFSFPAAGWYAVGITWTGDAPAPDAASSIMVRAFIELV